MDRSGEVPQRTWVAACSHRLQQQWRTVDPDLLEELAASLWNDERFRRLEPIDAAVEWLRPVLHDRGLPRRF
jgi:hypothetical protein